MSETNLKSMCVGGEGEVNLQKHLDRHFECLHYVYLCPSLSRFWRLSGIYIGYQVQSKFVQI